MNVVVPLGQFVDWSQFPFPDISNRAKWSVSSFKLGFGAECLRDDDPETFWHSDGPQPHFITIEFAQKVAMQKIALYLSFSQDDSYTPATIEIRAGTGVNDLQSINVVGFEKPDGWSTIDINPEFNEDQDGFKTLHAYVLQVIIIANHMSGKDTHVRGIKVLGPKDEVPSDGDPFPFISREYKKYEILR